MVKLKTITAHVQGSRQKRVSSIADSRNEKIYGASVFARETYDFIRDITGEHMRARKQK